MMLQKRVLIVVAVLAVTFLAVSTPARADLCGSYYLMCENQCIKQSASCLNRCASGNDQCVSTCDYLDELCDENCQNQLDLCKITGFPWN
jgi:hypothetical protein